MVEIRQDLLQLSDEQIKAIIDLSTSVVTCRSGYYSDQERLSFFENAMEAGAKYIDIELEAENSLTEKLSAACKAQNVRLIVSYHNYEETPAFNYLEYIYNQCIARGAGVVKIATQVNSREDIKNLIRLYDKPEPLIAIGMGEAGKVTRVLAPFLGAPFTYAAPDKGEQTAPGQIRVSELKELFQKLGGENG